MINIVSLISGMYGRDECLGQEGGEKHGGKGGGAVKTQSSYGRIEFTDGWMRYAYPSD